MEYEEASLATLGVAAELEAVQREVGLALAFDRGSGQPGQGLPVAVHDEVVGRRDAVQRAGIVDAQDQGIVEGPRPQQDRAAAGAAAQDGDVAGAAEGQGGLAGSLVGIAEHHEVP